MSTPERIPSVSNRERIPPVSNRERLLVVDDEAQMRQTLVEILTTRGYEVRTAASGPEALADAVEFVPAVILLDLCMPNLDGFEICKRLRSWYQAPILVLSVRSEAKDKIRALNLGADDYLTKPFVTGELLARVRALLRRAKTSSTSEPVLEFGDVLIDMARRRVHRAGEPVILTRTEFEILAMLARNADRVVTSQTMMEHLWGPPQEGDIFKLRVHVGNLRKKLEPQPGVPRYIITEPGVGYCFYTS